MINIRFIAILIISLSLINRAYGVEPQKCEDIEVEHISESDLETLNDDYVENLFPKTYSTSREFIAVVQYTLRATDELLDMIDNKADESSIHNDIGSMSNLKGYVEVDPDYRWLLLFLGYIAGINVDVKNLYCDFYFYFKIESLDEVLKYYAQHTHLDWDIYVYWRIYANAIMMRKCTSELLDVSGRKLLFFDEFTPSELLEKWPDSRAAAISSLQENTYRTRDLLFNILNKTDNGL